MIQDYDSTRRDICEWLYLKTSTGMFSNMLIAELTEAVINRRADQNLWNILDEIGYIEGASQCKPTGTKRAEIYRNERFSNLWHKHYACDTFRSIGTNLLQRWTGKRSREMHDLVKKHFPIGSMVTDKPLHHFVMDFVYHKGYQELSRNKQITGECIMFIKYDERNYYLTLVKHAENRGAARDAMLERCLTAFSEFSFTDA